MSYVRDAIQFVGLLIPTTYILDYALHGNSFTFKDSYFGRSEMQRQETYF